ncbi:Uridine nucleosidase 1 [Coemansia sp. RSA 2703]|nr:Uridine nucleosidase 1 [Coemansia sp. RSA 2703]
MGGAIGFGDFTPAAEFNFFCDPDAAQMVFQSGIENIVLIPLEVTNTVLSTKAVLKRIQDGIAVSKFSTFATEVLRVFGDTFSYIHDEKDGYPLQDPVAVAYLVMPHAFVKKHIHVSVECSPGDGNGRSYCDLFNRLKRTSNCWIATSVDVDLFWNEMTDALVKASTNSPWADSLYNI